MPFEQTDEGEASVAIAIAAVRGANIRPQGSDVRVGDVILERGRPVSSRHLAAAAAVGVTQLSVHPRPRVGIMATGSELRAVGMPLGTGLIHDSNTPMLCAAVREAGAAPVVLGPVSDRPAALLEALADGEGRVDVLVLAGGVGPGAYDVVRTTLASLGVRFSSVRIQPGKPQAFGVWRDGTPLFGLPGNPVAAYVSFEAFVRPALQVLRGLPAVGRPSEEALATCGWKGRADREQHLPVRLERGADGVDWARPASAGRSQQISGLAGADALAIVGEGTGDVHAGDRIRIVRLDGDL